MSACTGRSVNRGSLVLLLNVVFGSNAVDDIYGLVS